MPASYQPHTRADDTVERTSSQSLETNVAPSKATVKDVLDGKGRETFSIRPQETLHHAVEALRDRHIGALLVTDANGALIGILSERDIVRKLAETPGQTLPQKVEEVMTRKVETCTPEDLLVTVLKRMTEGRFRHMPVMDEHGLAGMVTIGDAVNFRLTQLEHEALQLKQLIVG
jgi:CBS domain-containing protein